MDPHERASERACRRSSSSATFPACHPSSKQPSNSKRKLTLPLFPLSSAPQERPGVDPELAVVESGRILLVVARTRSTGTGPALSAWCAAAERKRIHTRPGTTGTAHQCDSAASGRDVVLVGRSSSQWSHQRSPSSTSATEWAASIWPADLPTTTSAEPSRNSAGR